MSIWELRMWALRIAIEAVEARVIDKDDVIKFATLAAAFVQDELNNE